MVVPQRSNLPVDPNANLGAGVEARPSGGGAHHGQESVNPGALASPTSTVHAGTMFAIERFGTRLLASRFSSECFQSASSSLRQIVHAERLWVEQPSEPKLSIVTERFRVAITVEGEHWGDLCATLSNGLDGFGESEKAALQRIAEIVGIALLRDRVDAREQRSAQEHAVRVATADVAREFRSLLWPVQLNGEMLERSPQLQGRERQMLSDIMHVTATASTLVARLLADAPPSLADCTLPTGNDASGELPLARKGERVLFVDDEQVVREVASELLRELGYEVRTVDSAESGLRLLETDSAFSLVVTDLMMYEMDGISFAQEVHRRWPSLGVVCCTGYGDASDQSRAAAAGIRQLVRKPVPMESFARIIRTAIDCA